jgi:dihydroceramidase
MCYATFSYKKSRNYRVLLAVFLTSLSLFITLYYHYLEDPSFHEVAYALLTIVLLVRSVYVMETSLRPRFRPKAEAPAVLKEQGGQRTVLKSQEHVRDEEILSRMWSMIRWGASLFLGGFFIWSLDNVYCSALRKWRHQVGLPWGILSEGHGAWHLLTGIGAYFYLVWGIWLRHCLNGDQDRFELIWPHLYSLPVVVRRRKGPANGHHPAQGNGSVAMKDD